jgi:hypothetical protein
MDHIGIDVHTNDSQICILGAEGELSEQRVRTTPDRFADVLGDRPRAASSSRPQPRASGWRGVWKGWAMKSSSQTRTSRPCTPPAVARSKRIAGTPGRWPRPVGWEPTAPAHRLSDAQRHVRGRLTVRDALARIMREQ